MNPDMFNQISAKNHAIIVANRLVLSESPIESSFHWLLLK